MANTDKASAKYWDLCPACGANALTTARDSDGYYWTCRECGDDFDTCSHCGEPKSGGDLELVSDADLSVGYDGGELLVCSCCRRHARTGTTCGTCNTCKHWEARCEAEPGLQEAYDALMASLPERRATAAEEDRQRAMLAVAYLSGLDMPRAEVRR